MTVAQITYQDDDVVVETKDSDSSILLLSLENKIPHIWECGGKGKCTTCRVQVLEGLGNLSQRTKRETKLAHQRGWDDYTRLACQTNVIGDVVLRRMVRNSGDALRIRAEEYGAQMGRETHMAVLFCDLRNFTPASEKLAAFDLVHVLNRCFERMGEAVICNGGYIFQYAGDELEAWFGMKGGTPSENCTNAVRSALGMIAILGEINKGLQEEFGLSFGLSIGIHYGSAIVGHIGHSSYRQFSAIGDSINTASRIENANRDLATSLLVSRDVERRISVPLIIGQRQTVSLKGKQDKMEVIEIKGFADTDPMLLVQSTFERILGNPEKFGRRFYDRIFHSAPEARAMFKGDMQAQTKMFMEMLRYILHGINRFHDIAPVLKESGRRHAGYNVAPEHYALVVEAFRATLREELGSDFNAHMEQAWMSVMERITNAMISGA